ncbi:MAG TPA: hypothetical protein EYQ81_10165 [Sneathiellales bacterium]|nr:hypothetical protein [Sneathiellales bacterium]
MTTMRTAKYLTRYLVCSIVVLLVFAAPAHAYLDPGTGSMILQALATAGIGAMLYFAWFWKKIRNFFGGDTASKDAVPDNEETDKN